MSVMDVHIKKLAYMQVASVYGFGEQPELVAWEKMNAYAKPKGFFDDPEAHRIFGFNNPDPSPGSPNYGYENWVTVTDDLQFDFEDDNVKEKHFSGGLYAALVSPGIPNPQKWGNVVAWINTSDYQYDPSRQWLEEIQLNKSAMSMFSGEDPDVESFVFTLLSPIIPAGESL